MALKYGLTENLLTERPDDYSAITYSAVSVDQNVLIDRILKRGTTLTRTDLVAVMTAINETVSEGVEAGDTFNLPLFNTSFSISGVFDSPLDSFDGNRHKLNVNLTKGTLLRDAEKKVKLEKTNVTTPLPQIQEVKDSITGKVNEKLTVNGVVEVRGYNLKIDGDNASCGLWFVEESGAEIKAAIIIENKPERIIAMIPELLSGKYQVKVVTQHTGSGTILKTPKIFVYQKYLTT